MVLECPFCSGRTLVNKNVNHTFFCRKCNKNVLKRCYSCNEVIHEINLDTCPSCGSWLPDFPTSWCRTATHILWTKVIARIVKEDLKNSATHSQVGYMLLLNNYTVVDPDKLREKGIKYLRDTPRRRGREYTPNAAFMGLLRRDAAVPHTYSTTPIGDYLLKQETTMGQQVVFIDRLLKLKITNIYDVLGTYELFNTRPFLLALRFMNKLSQDGVPVTLNRLALAFMCRNENEDFDRAVSFARNSDEAINNYLFSNSRELGRVIRGVFIPWMVELGLVSIEEESYTITDLGKEVYNLYLKLLPIWYSKLEEDPIRNSATILLVRLLQHPMVTENDLLLSSEELKSVFKLLRRSKKENFDYDLYYDIPPQRRGDVIDQCSKMVQLNGNAPSMLSLLSKLQLVELEKVKEILSQKKGKVVSEDILPSKKRVDFTQLDRKAGTSFEREVRDILEELGFRATMYKVDRRFSTIDFPDEILWALPGGPRENPDIIVDLPILLLVDPKSDVNLEMYKLRAYDYYASHPEVNAYSSVIVTKAPLRNPQELKNTSRIVVITLEALKTLLENKDRMTSNQICWFFVPYRREGKYVDLSVVKDKLRAPPEEVLREVEIHREYVKKMGIIDGIKEKMLLGFLTPMAVDFLTGVCCKFKGEITTNTIKRVFLETDTLPSLKDTQVLYWLSRSPVLLNHLQRYWNVEEKIYLMSVSPVKIQVKKEYAQFIGWLDQTRVQEYVRKKEVKGWYDQCLSLAQKISGELAKVLKTFERIILGD